MRILRCLLVGVLGSAGLSLSAYACLNSYSQLRLGSGYPVHFIDADRLEQFIGDTKPDSDEIEWVRSVTAEARKNPTFEHRSDLAVGLVHLGRPKEAVELLQALENEHPGRYQTAANLGTAFELAGNNEAALKWIREGIRRNPEAHDGTEWLHAVILEAKLRRRAQGSPEQSILRLDFGPGPLPARPARLPLGNDGKPASVPELGLALRYQLIERTHFVAAPDPMVAGLLADWAHLELIVGNQRTAAVLYKAALDYGQPMTAQIRAGKAEAERQLSSAEVKARQGKCELCPRHEED
jgi:tetratricopeptide (TPR) repeat protein